MRGAPPQRQVRSVMQTNSRRRCAAIVSIASLALCASLAMELPANAQFWGGWGDGWNRRPQPPRQQQPQTYNPFGGLFGPPSGGQREQSDSSHAPGSQKKPEPGAGSTIVVLGDGMA